MCVFFLVFLVAIVFFSCTKVFEKTPTVVKNFGIWVRYTSRTGVHNMYKEYRDVTLTGAVDQLYSEMVSIFYFFLTL